MDIYIAILRANIPYVTYAEKILPLARPVPLNTQCSGSTTSYGAAVIYG
eukprot:COSAG03_NODE_4843_length_1414_cov_1.055513_1_plen_48_part_10